MYNLKDGDIIKILPIDMDSEVMITIDSINIDNDNRFFYEIRSPSSKDYLIRMKRIYGRELMIMTIYFINCLVNGRNEGVLIGRKLRDIINLNFERYDDDKHLLVSKLNTNTGVGYFPSYSNSIFINKDCDLSCLSEDCLKDNQKEDINRFIHGKTIMDNFDYLNEKFDGVLSDMIVSDRNVKLELLGI